MISLTSPPCAGFTSMVRRHYGHIFDSPYNVDPQRHGFLPFGDDEMALAVNSTSLQLPSGYIKVAIENGHL